MQDLKKKWLSQVKTTKSIVKVKLEGEQITLSQNLQHLREELKEEQQGHPSTTTLSTKHNNWWKPKSFLG